MAKYQHLTSTDHYLRAEQLLSDVEQQRAGDVRTILALAQVHATLASTQTMAANEPLIDHRLILPGTELGDWEPIYEPDAG